MDINSAAVELAYAIRRTLKPHLGLQSSKRLTGKAASGDEAFAIDDIAERVIAEFIRKHELPVAYYSEGRGFVGFGRPQHLLVIDPIDGTRPAMVGLEGGVVSIAVAPYSTDATLADVTFGCVLELKADRLYTATRDGAVNIRADKVDLPVTLTTTADLDKVSWSYEIAGRPILPITQVLAPLIDKSSLRGGVFVISSTAYSLTRMVSGQFDAVIDVGNRILRDHPNLRGEFVRAGLGTVIGLFPYDIAAALLIAETAGCHVTDAYGNSLGATALLDTSEENVRSCVAGSNPALHRKLLDLIDERMSSLACE
ncbi:MAG TPA: inositol monophosphatase family protein [Armatimonadota bacterium]|nr:inositol monophosphatase family protein [Armatimonadota bacterium]